MATRTETPADRQDPARQETPADRCPASKEELLNKKKNPLDIDDDCPICRNLYNVLCLVGMHPSRPLPSTTVNDVIATLVSEVSNVELKKLGEKIDKQAEKVDKIEQAVIPPAIYRTGSSVKTEDFVETFGFTCSTIDVSKDKELYSWTTEQFNAFKAIVKTTIFQKLNTLIDYANSADKMEDSSLRPVLMGLLSDLVPHAFSSIPNCEVIVDRFEYNDARIKDSKGRLIVFNGITDLSCLAVPQHIPVCGFENKISKKSLILKRTKVDDVNADGKKAMSQTASQILGAVNHFHALNMSVPIYTQIGTNGWQYLLVRRVIRSGSRCKFVASVPVSIGMDSEEGKIIAKPQNDHSYELISHMISLMFDNARFLIMKLLQESTLAIPLQMLKIDEQNDEDNDDDNDEGSFGKNPSNMDLLPPPPTNNNQSSSRQQSGNVKKSSGMKENRLPLLEINPIWLPLTASSLRYHNSIM